MSNDESPGDDQQSKDRAFANPLTSIILSLISKKAMSLEELSSGLASHITSERMQLLLAAGLVVLDDNGLYKATDRAKEPLQSTEATAKVDVTENPDKPKGRRML